MGKKAKAVTAKKATMMKLTVTFKILVGTTPVLLGAPTVAHKAIATATMLKSTLITKILVTTTPTAIALVQALLGALVAAVILALVLITLAIILIMLRPMRLRPLRLSLRRITSIMNSMSNILMMPLIKSFIRLSIVYYGFHSPSYF